MPSHSSPGVFVEETSLHSHSIEGVSTYVVAFVGSTNKGVTAEPILINKFEDYTAEFGDIASEADSMGLAVQAYYLNGGETAYICSLSAEISNASVYTDFYDDTLHKYHDISIIVLPDEQMSASGAGNAAIRATLAYCKKMENCILIIDPPQGYELDDANAVTALSLPTSSYSVFYYPWVKVANPFYHSDTSDVLPKKEKTLLVAPSAIAAGMWVKTDKARGVWKSPAGVQTQLTDVEGLEFNVDNLQQEQLGPLGVNCIRELPNHGLIFWGARTLATNANIEMRYIPVRRMAIYIKESIDKGTQWVALEANNALLWATLRENISIFMNGLARSGAFMGMTDDQAYFVRCDLNDTMTVADIDNQTVIVRIGFAPLKPAEFVILRIQQKTGAE
ncbi:MAG TPA: phage tail sheath family protein [Leucothrix mucor]|nr:phage tail sheath family protein [Leucothrix mucor]